MHVDYRGSLIEIAPNAETTPQHLRCTCVCHLLSVIGGIFKVVGIPSNVRPGFGSLSTRTGPFAPVYHMSRRSRQSVRLHNLLFVLALARPRSTFWPKYYSSRANQRGELANSFRLIFICCPSDHGGLMVKARSVRASLGGR